MTFMRILLINAPVSATRGKKIRNQVNATYVLGKPNLCQSRKLVII